MGMLPAHATLESITASASFGHRFYTGIEMLNRLLVSVKERLMSKSSTLFLSTLEPRYVRYMSGILFLTS